MRAVLSTALLFALGLGSAGSAGATTPNTYAKAKSQTAAFKARILRAPSRDPHSDVVTLCDPKYKGRDPSFPDTYRQVATFGAEQLQAAGVKPLYPAALRPGVTGIERYFHNFDLTNVPTMNVVGVRRAASGTSDAIVVVAHLDHFLRYGGANDNAAGSATLMQVARNLMPNALNKNVIFVLTSAEERGLVGMRKLLQDQFVEKAGYKIKKVINFDMPAAGNAKEVELYAGHDAAEERANPLFQQANRIASKLGMKALPGSEHDNGHGIFQRSDHYAAYLAGIKDVIFFFGGMHGPYHDPKDTPEKLTPGKMANVAEFGAELTRVEAGLSGAPAGNGNAIRRSRKPRPLPRPPVIELPEGWRPLGEK